MTQYRFAGRVQVWEEYVDFDINTDNPNEYWVLSYDNALCCWYATQHISETDDGPFEEGGTASPQEIAQMLATMPVNLLPARALLGKNK
jgi:hypothetical protein